jgi:hypothetical protein
MAMKSKALNPGVFKLLYVVLLFLLLCPVVSSGKDRALNSLNITTKLYNERNNAFMDLKGKEIKFTSQKAIWKEGDSIQKLLEANRFWTDGESVGILYKLNPDLDAKSLKAGKEIILPAVKNKDEFSDEFAKGYLVYLTLDDALKQEFCDVSKELNDLPEKTSQLNVQKFESPGEKDNFLKATKSIVVTMKNFKDVIEDRSDPLSSDMLTQMLVEAAQAKSIIIHTINGKQKLSRSDAQTLELIAKNMDSRQKILKEEKGDPVLPGVVATPEKALWNAWFEDVKGSYVEVLKPSNDYFFTLDVSRFSYFKDYEAVVDLSARKLIDEALASGKTEINFVIRPVLLGDADVVRFTENQGRSRVLEKRLKIDIKKLFKEKDESGETKLKSMHKEWTANKLILHQFASLVQAGEVKFGMKVDKPGDAELSVSIWDQSGMIPLDHLIVAIQVPDPNVSKEKRSVTKYTVPFRAGRGTLLEVSLDFSSTAPLVADAAFHVFEPSRHGYSMVLFAAKTDQGICVNAWETGSLLSYYIEHPKEKIGLIGQIKEARDRAAKKNEAPYELAAQELKEKIFDGNDKNDQKQADEAARIFRELVQEKNKEIIVFARMRNEKGKPVYLPLGILAAKSKNSYLPKRIILVQPLPREHYPGGAHPVKTWTYNIPVKLADSPMSNNDLSQLKIPYSSNREISKVRDFFKEDIPPDPKANPEGIILLAHQAGGNLWFNIHTDRITTAHMKREFPPGSVAIISACSAATSEGNNQAILEKLNKNMIDAMIVSPFPVEANYGAMLAINFVEAIKEAKGGSKGLSLAELFNIASKKTANHFKTKAEINFEDMDLEFLIAGDYRIKIAPKE